MGYCPSGLHTKYMKCVTSRVGVKYNWSSTQILQVLVIKYKYKYFAFSPIKYSSTSSTDTPSTSTSTSVNIGWLIYMGSFRVKSPKITENLNPTVSDFNQTWYTCCLGTHSTKSKILGQSDQWCGRYGPPNFESFGKNVRGCQPLNPHIS